MTRRSVFVLGVILVLLLLEVFFTAEPIKRKAGCRVPLAAYVHGGSPKDNMKCEVKDVRESRQAEDASRP